MDWILFSVLLMVIVMHPSYCLRSFEWKQGQPCEAIPFPFGTCGRALPGFEINCSSGKAYLLPAENLSYLIQEISSNTVIIIAQNIYNNCNRENGSYIIEDNSGFLNIESTPYTISGSANELILFGCGDLLVLYNWDQTGSEISCLSYCDRDHRMMIQQDCLTYPCCTRVLPQYGLKSFDLSLPQISNKSDNQAKFGTLLDCSIAFIAVQRALEFATYDAGSFPFFLPLTLEWAIGNTTCQEAKKRPETYRCMENSDCYDSYSGYYCNCSQGFQGNPYIFGGCTDIDECEAPDMNPCTRHCINEIGSVSCACPRGMGGDGRRDGSGCIFPLDLTLGLGLGSLLVLITSSFFVYLRFQRKNIIKMRTKYFRQNGGNLLMQRYDSEGIDPKTKIFTGQQLKKATDNYNQSRILGQGGFGTVYRGILHDKRVVAIKKSKLSDESQVAQFINEIIILSQINHRNVVKLIGCCLETEVPLLVYEFVPNGTLYNRIHRQIAFPWKERLQIAADAAGAVAYLHSAASPAIIHRDIKSANILLDEKYTAKISDFGASRSVPFDQTHVTTVVQGTFGYLDPEYFTTHQLTEKSDVYSFGVVLAELLLREKPISHRRPIEIQGLAAYFEMIVSQGQLAQVMAFYVVEQAGVEQIEAIGRLTVTCLSLRGDDRPTMNEVGCELDRLLRQTIAQESAQMEADALVSLQNAPMVTGQSSDLCGKEKEVTRRYSLDRSMYSSMELPR